MTIVTCSIFLRLRRGPRVPSLVFDCGPDIRRAGVRRRGAEDGHATTRAFGNTRKLGSPMLHLSLASQP